MIDYLNTQSVIGFYSQQSTQHHYQGFTIPNPCVRMAKPLSYLFRVAEFVNDQDEVMKIGLQVAVFEHDNEGVKQLRQDWTDVERVKVKL